jgi:hypothetical protein
VFDIKYVWFTLDKFILVGNRDVNSFYRWASKFL